MRNYKGTFYRTDETSREPEHCSDWLDALTLKMQVEGISKTASSKSAVEVARNRQQNQPSIYEMMSAIVSGQKPKYSSVEEAVKDYQRRTGLEDYLKRASDTNLNALANQIITEAAKGVCSKCGNSYAECECDEDDAKDGKTEDDEEDEPEPEDEDEEEAEGDDEDDEDEEEEEDEDDAQDFFRRNLDYGNAQDKKTDWRDLFGKIEDDEEDESEPEYEDYIPELEEFENELKPGHINADSYGNSPDRSDPDYVDDEIIERKLRREMGINDSRDMTEEELEANPGKKKLISEAANKPALLEKNPAIEHFLTNVIDTNYGIQMPAILHTLLETFGRDGVDHNIFSDRELLDWINQQLINKGISVNNIPSHLGRGVGTHIDYSGDKDSNKDPFTLLVPDKSSL
jgi:hypothetical protein